ncbi:conserved hypothetical protein [Rhodopseudomonas palustris HaA2]|uniref:GmrSD restriction endonucleases N-terminal domain-containing protein n=1 Tax=Rhodopseudomonas palustris (strain HaA2) TaxID=316058 RepID=Q2IY10_RHOP2|nr:DUF262 domain-containing protein [Rhodopseudomonas palustris]ABD06900.1 conserved hypothetical protein [Rhodopseudomonas palustris HaA2]
MANDNDDCEEQLTFFTTEKPHRTQREIEAAESQIVAQLRDVRYVVREYPIEVVVQMYLSGRSEDRNEIYVPDYQRDLIWSERHKSRFVESLLIGLPIPFLFVADVGDEEDPDKAGRLEIVDGVQRIRTLAEFLTGRLTLSCLDRLDRLNGFRFNDLPISRQRRFRRATLRLIELTEAVTEDVRREMFDRINSGSVNLKAVEVRRGMQRGPFLDLVTELAAAPLLHQLAPISDGLRKRFEYEELVTRFFAFLYRYEDYGKGGKVVSEFLLNYVRDTNKKLSSPEGDRIAEEMKRQWHEMLEVVRGYFPDGFKKRGPGRKVPRVRFEAIAVGIGLAIRALKDDGDSFKILHIDNIDEWLESDEFKEWTTSDASNNKSNLVGRLEFVRNKMLGR